MQSYYNCSRNEVFKKIFKIFKKTQKPGVIKDF